MLSKVKTAALSGIDAHIVTVETDLSNGLPAFNTVGLASTTIREAKERIRAAVKNSGYSFPLKRITVNLSPADSRKEGSHFDLPMAIGILICCEYLPQARAEGTAFIGELSLDGRLKKIRGALPLVIALAQEGITRVVLPRENAREVSLVKDIEIYPAEGLAEIAEWLAGHGNIEPFKEEEKPLLEEEYGDIDFKDVIGQESAKRAIEISVCGGHNIYFIGPPGTGKSMLAKRIPTIMHRLDYEDMLEITKIYSVAGLLSKEEPMITKRPFRTPHCSVTPPAFVGGGRNPRPGEISLAHGGVLFMDEFPEFSGEVIEMLRQPIEQCCISIDRVEGTVKYPCRFILVAAGNPCKCGYYGDRLGRCTCSIGEINRYRRKLSGPMSDRIDLQIRVERIGVDILQGKNHIGRSSAEMREQVAKARQIQLERYAHEEVKLNSSLEGSLLRKYCPLDKESRDLLKNVYNKLGISARSYEKIIKISRTIADMEGVSDIKDYHVAEALQYRVLDRPI